MKSCIDTVILRERFESNLSTYYIYLYIYAHTYICEISSDFLTTESYRTFIIQPKERNIFFWKLFSISSYVFSFSCRRSGKVILLNL